MQKVQKDSIVHRCMHWVYTCSTVTNTQFTHIPPSQIHQLIQPHCKIMYNWENQPLTSSLPPVKDYFFGFLYIFQWARVCWPLLGLCRPFWEMSGFEPRELPQQAGAAPLSHPSPYFANHLPTQPPIPLLFGFCHLFLFWHKCEG